MPYRADSSRCLIISIAENPRLAKMIEDTEARYGAALSDDSLEFVSAAGETDIPQKKSKGGKEKR